MLRYLLSLMLIVTAAPASLVKDVRAAIDQKDMAKAERLVAEHRKQHGATPETIVALSWLARGALGQKEYTRATARAAETRTLVLAALKTRKLDDDKDLPTALGAAIEVHAQAMAAQGGRDLAVTFLQRELARWRATSIRARIQKNINLLSLEGKPAPALEVGRWVGAQPKPLAALRGQTVLLFLWAHWCGDCKAMAPVLAKLEREYGDDGLAIVAPTQRYGYARRGEDATPEEELKYIEEIWRQSYADLKGIPAPVSEESFRNYGASTTPTVVIIDPAGIVRLYHPGEMTYEELAQQVEKRLPARQGS